MLESAVLKAKRRTAFVTVVVPVIASAAILALGAATVFGCAEGADEGLGGVEDDIKSQPDAGGKLPPPGDDDDDDSGDDDDDDDSGTPAPDAGKVDAGNDAGAPTDAGKVDAGGPSGGNCAAPTACAQAKSLGEISGDTGADVQTTSGTTSAWFTVDVTEDNNSLGGAALRVRATLTSPPGVDFDLYTYFSSDPSARECSLVAESSRRTTATDTVNLEWGEGALPNGAYDDAKVTFEVRRVSGTCDANSKWTLNIEGNRP